MLLNNLLNEANSIVDRNIDSEKFKTDFKALFAQRKIPFSSSVNAHFFNALFDEKGIVTASAALLAELGVVISESARAYPEVILGLAAWSNNGLNYSVLDEKAEKRALRELANKFSINISELEIKRQEIETLIGTLMSDSRQESEAWDSEKTASFAAFETTMQSGYEEALDKFENTRAAYEEHMRLRKPAEYWEIKGEKHKTASKRYRWIALAWVVSAGLGLGLGLWCLSNFAIDKVLETPDLPAHLLFLLSSIGLVGSTVVFWISRVLVRLYLSELHLSMDAEERNTMMQCYLALTNEGGADQRDRNIILTSLFRSTQDGIVKDDSSADPTLIGLLGKLGK